MGRTNMQFFFALMMSLTWCATVSALILLIRRQSKLYIHSNMKIILLLATVCIIRPFFTYEPPFSIVVNSDVIYPAMVGFLMYEVFGKVNVLTLLGLLWALGTILLSVHYLHITLRFKKWLLSLESIRDERFERAFEQIAGHTRCKLIISKSITGPAFCGVFTPSVLMPVADFSNEELDIVLRHEVSHYVNNDIHVRNIARFLGCLFWWNPLTHILYRDICEMQEYICDIRAAKDMSLDDRSDYVLKSIAITKKLQTVNADKMLRTVGCAGYVDSCDNYEHRMRSLIQYNKGIGRQFRRIILSLCAVTLLMSYLFIFQPAFLAPEGDGTVDFTSSYLVPNDDGTYNLFVNGEYVKIITDITSPPLSLFPIYTTENSD